jgi:hypothetical protein
VHKPILVFYPLDFFADACLQTIIISTRTATARITDRISNASTEGVDDVGPRFDVGISEVACVTGRENVFVLRRVFLVVPWFLLHLS